MPKSADKAGGKKMADSAEASSIVISFRLSPAAYEPYREAVERSGKSRSRFFSDLFDDSKKKVVIAERREATEDYRQYLHLVNKVSNNLNQIARRFNSAEKSGIVTPEQYLRGLNSLNSIRLLLNAKLDRTEK